MEDNLLVSDMTPEEINSFKAQLPQQEQVEEEIEEQQEIEEGSQEEEVVEEEQQEQSGSQEEEPSDSDIELTEQDIVSVLNEELRSRGLLIESVDQIVEFYNQAKANQDNKITPEEWHRIKIARENGGDWTLYDAINSIDTEKMDDKEKLRTKYLLENRGDNPDFLNARFEREWKAKYIAENEEDEKYIEMLIQSDAKKADKYIKEYQSKFQLDEGEQEEQIDTAEQDRLWFEKVDGWISEIEQNKGLITFKIEDKSVNVEVNKDQLLDLRDALDNPMKWFYSQVSGENGTPDADLIKAFVVNNAFLNELLEEFYKQGSVTNEKKSLERASGKDEQKKTTPIKSGASFQSNILDALKGF